MYELDTHILDNGLTVSISPSATSPMVAIQAWVRVGSADDPPSKAGLAHLVEHLLFKGSRHYRSGELAGVIERAGGEVNAWTSPDQTVFHAVVRRAYFPEALEALSDTLVEPRFEPGELERERSVVLQELRHGGGTVERLLGKCLLSTAFLMHPYRRPVIGSEDTLSAIAVRDVADLYRGFYVGPNLTLVIAGDVDREDVLRRVALRFGGLPAARPPRRSIREPAQGTPRVAVVEHTAPGARLAIAFPAPALRDPEVAALEVAAVVLSQRASFAAVAGGDAGPTGYVRALHDASLFVVEAAPAPAALAAAVTGLLRELRGLSQDLEQQELERAQAALELERERQLETVQGRARALGWHAAMTGDAGFERVHAERVRRLRRVDPAVTHRWTDRRLV
ncbi:MAG TPA: pitrilysin family protein, partial [Kofleriaceae bacterium]|nr:pitrilysin family protein [Kofleriaceae bacterium]